MPNIAQIIHRNSCEAPDQVCIHLLHSRRPDQILTYRDLFSHSAHYASSLQQAGIQPGEVVILILQHGLDLIASFYGSILSGAIPSIMPFLTEKLLPQQYRASLAALFEITAPAAIITYADFYDEVVAASQNTSVRKVLIAEQINSQTQDAPLPMDDSTVDHLNGLERCSDEIVLLQHSSGTTGLQKGVALSHQAVLNQLNSYSKALQLTDQDVIVSWLPLYHDMGLIAGFILPILLRIPLILLSPFDWVRAPYRLFQAISRYQGTLCWLPNFAYNFCTKKIRGRDLAGVDLSSLRAVINCSEPMHWNSHAMFLERFSPYGLKPQVLATCYAMAENVFAVTQGGIHTPVTVDLVNLTILQEKQIAEPVAFPSEPQDDADTGGKQIVQMLSAGYPIQGTRVRVVDPQGTDLPERHIGEIALQSDCMLTGYFHRPDLTEKAFQNGWYLTGDLGYLASGELYVTGRKKDLIIVGGKNIYPQDLERLASKAEGVHPGRVVAFGVYNEDIGTEEVVMIAEADFEAVETGPISPTAMEHQKEMIAAEIRQQVTRGSDIALRYVMVVERNWLIKTSSGKVARSANRARYLAELALSTQPPASVPEA